jgi:hypothetical protein
MAKMTEFTISIDARGFLRFVAATAAALKVQNFGFADIFIDKKGKRVGLKLSNKEKPGSFRLLDHEGRHLVFIKGALVEAKLPTKSGRFNMVLENGMLILAGKSSSKGEWVLFPCRNSPNIPMASLDSRGTLILDRNCTSALQIPKVDTATASFDAKKKEMTLTLVKSKGDLNVRSIGSHANISLMGTLSSYGLKLPKASVRFVCTLDGKTVRFNLASLAPATR